MKDISGYRSNFLQRFRPVLKKWIELNEIYCRESKWNDIPWGYIERSSVSIFAAACWSAGCIALEEFSELKTSRSSRKRKGESALGRCDLYVAFKNKPYILEAKMVRPSLASNDWRGQVLTGLKGALGDVQLTHAPNRENKLGLLIVAPTVPRNRTDKSELLIERFVEFLRSHEGFCSAWYFPKNAKIRQFTWNNEKERMYPGSAVLIRALRNSN